MNSKGQIMSLDAVMALAIVMLSLGIAFNVMEANAYNLKEEQLFEELSSVGRSASNLLVSNPEIICKIRDSGGTELFSMNNCLMNGTHISKAHLGIGDEYKCRIDIGIPSAVSRECRNVIGDAENVYSETREVAIVDADFSKPGFNVCLGGGDCAAFGLQTTSITISVWKNE